MTDEPVFLEGGLRGQQSGLDLAAMPPGFESTLPFTNSADIGDVALARGGFLYIGQGMKPNEFAAYVESYNFGSQPPNFVVIHHTAIPQATFGRGSGWWWDSGEQGMSEQQIYSKRLRLLGNLRSFYMNSLGWDRGPHLFIDDRWIWLFTPMYYRGIHAAAGNGGPGGYSIGIEVVGNYSRAQWIPQVQNLVGFAVAVIKRRINTFELVHKPMYGGVSGHRDYNKPSCPGAAITNNFYIGVIQRGWANLHSAGVVQPKPTTPTTPTKTPALRELNENASLLGNPSGTQQQAMAYIKQRLSSRSEYKNDVGIIMGYYWKYAPPVGVDPFLAAGQCIFETDSLRSAWAARPLRNPAGLGVRQERGLTFATWEDGVQAHIGQLLAFALTDAEANDAQRAMMRKNPRHRHITAAQRGSIKRIGDMNNRWTSDRSYASKLLTRLNDIKGQRSLVLGSSLNSNDEQPAVVRRVDQQWLSDVPIAGRLGSEELAERLAHLTVAEEGEEPTPAAPPSGNLPWLYTGYTVGYLPPARSSADRATVMSAANLLADTLLRGALVDITLDSLRVAEYPGGGTHRLLLHFAVEHNVPSGNEHAHVVTTSHARSEADALILGVPLFRQVHVGSDGVLLRGYSVNVQNPQDEPYLDMLERPALRKGVLLQPDAQPAQAVLAAHTLGMTRAIAQRAQNLAVHEFMMDLTFLSLSGSLCLAEGSYVIAQVPDHALPGWNWADWEYEPSTGQILSKVDEDSADEPAPLPYNYLMLGVHRSVL